MDPAKSPIVGIDLGTTNSVVAALVNGKLEVIRDDGEELVPSVVGMTTDGTLVVGQIAKNQLVAFPDRTIASVKRRMGEAIQLPLAGQEYSPQEISAMILRRLREIAERALGQPVTRAVITVPAFFDENQRQATREAGSLAGLTVERIINEPTAASLVYCADQPDRRHLIVYDLGGGTFDVSIVRIEAGVVEVLSSRGDTKLGGDDFDELLASHVAAQFLNEFDYDLMENPATRWRLLHACERAKRELSEASVVRISEEFIATVDGKPLHLDLELKRSEYETLIAPLIERTIGCVDEAIRDSRLTTTQLDELILVGGSTRTPLVQQRLREEFHRDPKWSVNPDLAVALGAATQAAMQEGTHVGPVLIDVATHTLGIETLEGNPFSADLVFTPIIRRNSPLPARHEEMFHTVRPGQKEAEIVVYQGESTNLNQNRKLGSFRLRGLNDAENADGAIQVRFDLTLDGILKVTAIEHRTGLTESLTIDNALSRMGTTDDGDRRERLESLFLPQSWQAADDESIDDEMADDETGGDAESLANADTDADTVAESAGAPDQMRFDQAEQPQGELHQLIARARALQPTLGEEDASDVALLLEQLEKAQQTNDVELLDELHAELDDLLFYVTE
jgi:molecular chaperone DnaK